MRGDVNAGERAKTGFDSAQPDATRSPKIGLGLVGLLVAYH